MQLWTDTISSFLLYNQQQLHDVYIPNIFQCTAFVCVPSAVPLHPNAKGHTALLHTAANSRTNRTSGIMPSYSQLHTTTSREFKSMCFLPGTGLEGGVGRELRVQDRRGVEASDAEHLYLQGWAPEPEGCPTGRRCPRCWTARPPPPADAPGRKHDYRRTLSVLR